MLDEIIEIENNIDDPDFNGYIDILKRKKNADPDENPISDKRVGCSITCRNKITFPYYLKTIEDFTLGYVIMHKHEYSDKNSLRLLLQGYDIESSDDEPEVIYPVAYVFLTEKNYEYIKIELICVETEYSSLGIARRLMEKVFEYYENYRFEKIILDAVDIMAIIFFEKFGFVIDKSRYVQHGDKTTPMKYTRN